MAEGTPVQKHLNDFNSTIVDLESLDVKIEDEDKAIFKTWQMDHSVRAQVGSSSGRVMFWLSDISDLFSLSRVWVGSGRFRVNQFFVKYARHGKTSNFVENFESGMVRFWSIRTPGPLSCEHI